jgi:hypothetical protein
MQAISNRTQLRLIGAAYAGVLSFTALTLYARYSWEQAHLADVLASSGMYAGGDMLLAMFLTLLVLVPTFFLVRLISQAERPAQLYAGLMLAVALSAPVALALFRLGGALAVEPVGALSFMRLFWSPFVLALLIASRLLARFPTPSRILNFALLAEGGTLALSLALLLRSVR